MARAISRKQFAKMGETQDVELKASLGHQRDGFQALCGMLNAEGASGRVIFGVTPDKRPVGVEAGDLDSAQRKLAETARQGFDPPLQLTIELLDCEGATLVSVQATRLPTVPFHEFEGRAFIREGSSRRRLTTAEKEGLLRRRRRDLHPGPWRCDRCHTQVGMLNNFDFTASGPIRSFRCDCGGEFWPAG